MKARSFIIGLAVFAATVVGFNPPLAHAASQYVPVNICHANGDGTFTAESLLFASSGAAQRLTDASGYSHINDTNADLWAAFNFAGQYTSVNVPASHALLMQVTTTTYVSTRYFHGYVTTTSWVPDPAKVAILNNGCVVPAS